MSGFFTSVIVGGVEVPFSRGLAKSLPIYVVFFVVISLLIFFPILSLWLPRLMGVY